MADSENVAGPSGDKNNNRKCKHHSLDEVLRMLDSDSSDHLCDDTESEDSLDNDSDNDSQIVRTGDVDISSLLNNTNSEDRTDLDTRHELSDSDSDYSVSRSDIDSSDSDNSAENIAPPASVQRGRGRGRTAVRRGVRSERGGRGRGTRGRGRTGVMGGIRNIDESSFYVPDKQQPEIVSESVRAPTVRQLQHEDLARLKERHFPHKIPQTGKSHSTSRKCKVCSSKGK